MLEDAGLPGETASGRKRIQRKACTDRTRFYISAHGQSILVQFPSLGGGSQLQFPLSGPQPQFQSHHASNSSRCSSSVIENSSSSPNWLRSFSVITTSIRGTSEHSRSPWMHECRVEESAVRGVGPNKAVAVDAELLLSFRCCEVQRAAIKFKCCK
jgi:hypothetical protein